MEMRNDWTLPEVEGLFALPFMDLVFQAPSAAPSFSHSEYGAGEHAAQHKNRRLSRGLRVLPTKRALRKPASYPKN